MVTEFVKWMNTLLGTSLCWRASDRSVKSSVAWDMKEQLTCSLAAILARYCLEVLRYPGT